MQISLIRGSAPPLGIAAAANELLRYEKEKVMAPKFEVGSLGALVATDGLSALREAGKAADTGPALAIYYAQKWRNVSVQPDMKLTPAKMAAWIEDEAYDAWLALKPKKGSNNAFPFMVPGAMPLLLPSPSAGARLTLFAAVCRRQQAQPRAECGGALGRQTKDVAER